MPASARTVDRCSKASFTWSAMLAVVGGLPSGPMAVWPEQTSTRSAALISTACENPKALDHSQGFTSLRSIEDDLRSGDRIRGQGGTGPVGAKGPDPARDRAAPRSK